MRGDMLPKNKETQTQRAIIYCRVSSKKQKEEGSGLDSQEYRCRDYATAKGWPVEAVFPDDVSGGGDFMNRPGMVALLAYLDAQQDKDYVVVFDDLKRFARDTEFHIKLRRELKKRGAIVECLNFRFEDTPEGKFIETVFAAHGELEREQNGRQVRQKMRARLEQGFWVFQAPIGYRYSASKRGGKELIRDEPLASIVQDALEGYACGRFDSQVEVKRYLESQPVFPKNKNGEVPQQRVTDILTQPIYAGFITHKKWEINAVQGRHDALISLDMFEKIQARRTGAAKVPTRKNINHDFPLRGFVLCHDCDQPLTACWSKGQYKKYAYYLCDTKGCESYRKSIPRAKIEGEFEAIVRVLQPTQNMFDLVKAMFKDAWNKRTIQSEVMLETLKQEAKDTKKQMEDIIERIMEANSPAVIAAYESKVEKLERKRLLIEEKLQNAATPKGRFEDVIELGLTFLANPYKLWASGSFTLKRTVLRLAFAERPSYCRKKGYRTPKMALPFKVLQDICACESDLVPLARLERARPCGQQILSLSRLPIPPQGPDTVWFTPLQEARTIARRVPASTALALLRQAVWL